MADILVCIILFAVYASSSSPMLFSVVRPAVIFNIPPVFLASACILFYFGIVFFNSYRTLHHQTTARTTMVKFAILAFFATFSFIMVATTIIYFHLAPVNSSIFAYKTFCILYEVTMYALFGPVFFALATSEMPEINLPRIFNSNTNFYLRTPPLRDDLERSNSRKSVRFIVASPTTPSREYFDSVGSNYSSMHTITIEPSSTVMSGELPSQPSRSRRSSRHTCHPRNSMASSFSQKSTPPSPLTPVRFPPFAHKEEE
ncbi:hypothetical protein BDF19DRAFT_81786 [Syncephalis fuscata]|nr:hypothetical protein BDF19DRAFT_81786 [Syncephalis fuscata]